MTEKKFEIGFPYEGGRLPAHSNAVLVNVISDGAILIDFGFFDPLAYSVSQNTVEHISRVVITRDTAEQLVQSISSALKANENGDVIEFKTKDN